MTKTLPNPAPLTLVVASLRPDAFDVHRVRGRESLSRTYAFDVRATSAEPIDELLGSSATLTLEVGGRPRVIHGVVTRVRAGDERRADTVGYVVRIEPRLALLRHERTSRIFQDETVADVVRRVLGSLHIPNEWRLTRELPLRPFVVQYRESSLAFVERLLSEAGIFYRFESRPGVDREVIVFGDAPSAYALSDSPAMQFADVAGSSTSGWDKVTAFRRTTRVAPTRARFRDRDPDRPGLALDSTARVGRAGAVELVEGGVDDARGVVAEEKAADAIAALAALLPHAERPTDDEHDGAFLFPEWRDVRARAAAQLGARRRRAEVCDGESRSSAMAPGGRFVLHGHTVARMDGDYVVVSVTHDAAVGRAAGLYENAFECVPASTAYLPAPPKRRVTQSTHTATVVGPPGEEIHVDVAGRIKIHFHWDRRGGSDTSCWIRPMQAWSGTGWGSQFIPRVGMEVVVAFDGGDLDRPIVLGCVTNGTHPPVFPIGDKTRSGVRTQTYKGSGHNELSFEDAPEREQIFLRAQRDLDEKVGRNHSLRVGADEALDVVGHREERIGRTASLVVSGERRETIDGDVTIQHRRSRIDAVEKDMDLRVSGVRTTRVGVRDELEVQGVAEHRFAKDATTRVLGNATLIVGESDASRSLNVHAEGVATLSASKQLVLEATEGLVLRCGKTTLRIGEDGIELSGGAIRAATEKGSLEVGAEGVKLLSGDGYARFDDKILLKTGSASVSMSREVKIDGDRVLLNAPDKAKEEPAPPPRPPTGIVLTDQAGEPLPSCRFVIALDGGGERSGVTDRDGKAQVEVPANGKIRFPDLTDVG